MYEIKRTSIKGDYSLVQGDQEIFVFKAGNFMSSSSEAYYQGQRIELIKTWAFSKTHEVFKNGEQIAEIKFDWQMNATIRIQDLAGDMRRLVFKKRWFLSQTFDLMSKELDLHILSLDFKLRVEKMNMTYRLEVSPRAEEIFDMPEVIICCMHALRRHRRKMANG